MDGERLKEIRRDHNDTQESLAKKLGFSTPSVSKWEQGTADPNLQTLIKICRLYNVTSDYLLGLSDHDPLLWQAQKARLSESSQKQLELFEAFLEYKQENSAE